MSGSALAVNDMTGGPAVHQLNFQSPVTAIAADIYELHVWMMVICGVIFLAVFGVMFYSILKHRKSVGLQGGKFPRKHDGRDRLDSGAIHHRYFDGLASDKNCGGNEGHIQR
jgi:heme/copper-type cytochrome/quinol oxidase subunit 2